MSLASSADKSAASIPLKSDNLSRLETRARIPFYNRDDHQCGILHMSVGGFHRSHQAVYIDELMNHDPADWLICGVGLLDHDLDNVKALQKQDTLYSVLQKSVQDSQLRIVGSMKEIHHAPSDPEAVINRMVDPAIKIVSLTVTEKGYYYTQSGDLNSDHPAIQNDLNNQKNPVTFYGYVTEALRQRKNTDEKPFTVMSCDNLPGNGDLTKRLLLAFIEMQDPNLRDWVAENVSFPNAMVDRITPATTQNVIDDISDSYGIQDNWPVLCEDYIQWILEDNFCNGRPPLEEVGVKLVPDVEPYEKMKVRLLNGSHSALAYPAYLMGYRDVDLAMADPLIRDFIRKYMDENITDSIPDVPGINLDDYKNTLIERFSNPAIRDQILRLAQDGSQKIHNAWVPCIKHQLENGGSIKFLALAIAAWFRFLQGSDENMDTIPINDPLADILTTKAQLASLDPAALLAIDSVFDDLNRSEKLFKAVKDAMAHIHEHGMKKTLEYYVK